MDTDLEISPRAIRNTRMRRGLSIIELAERAGMSYKTLSEIERGDRAREACRMSTLRRIAAALDVEVADLLVEVPAERPAPVPASEGAA